MNSKFLPYGRQTITSNDIEAVVDVLRSAFLTQGPMVPDFEHAVATKVGGTWGCSEQRHQRPSHCMLGFRSWVW